MCLQAGLLPGTVDDMCCQLSGEDSLLRYRLFPAWLGTERVTGQGVYWNTVFSSAAAAAVQLQYSRNIVLLCGRFPRPALNFTLNALPQLYSTLLPLPCLCVCVCVCRSVCMCVLFFFFFFSISASLSPPCHFEVRAPCGYYTGTFTVTREERQKGALPNNHMDRTFSTLDMR